MGIDRIGGGGSIPPEALTPKEGVAGGTPAAAPFAVERASVAPTAAAPEVKPSAALEGVRSGALDVKGYVDAKVVEATSHLTHLTPVQLHTVQSVVRDQLLSDPHLRELVERATGSPPPAGDDE